MMNIEQFKQYLDTVVEKAFKEGVVWKSNGEDLYSMDEAIKNAQDKILEGKVKE